MITDYHGTPIADVPRYIPCIVVYPNGQTRKTGVRNSKLHTIDQGLARLQQDLAAFVADEQTAGELLEQWQQRKAAQ